VSAGHFLLDPELQQQLDDARARQLDALGRDSLIWLAVLPEWTRELAEACRFPAADLDAFVNEAEAAGLCERRRIVGLDGALHEHFWMPGSEREAFLGETRSEGRRLLRDTTAEIGGRIIELASDPSVDVSPDVRRWAQLASGVGSSMGGGRRLGEAIKNSIASGSTADAVDWIAAGEALVPVVGGDLEAAVTRGKRRLNLAYRRRYDERALAHFVRREEQIAAVRRLLESADMWALHFVGMGGVGKTMLLRYIGAGFARDHDVEPFAVGRIDFDHVDPRYPFNRPAQLLVELVDALAAYAQTDAQDAAIEAFVEAVRQADTQRAPGASVKAVLDSDGFGRVLDAFARVVGLLPQPVVLILDTCEELAKLHPAGDEVPSVDATFDILERLNQRSPALRVIFAGRRLLARSGAGWPEGRASTGRLPMSLSHRGYLALHEVRGFDEHEARRFLRDLAGDAASDAVVAAILERSKDLGRIPGVATATASADDPRYNPFDLALYGGWLRDDPGVVPGELADASTDAYVAARIVGRITEPELESALPAAALLERFDAAMLSAAVPGADPVRLLALLAEQEWVSAAGSEPASMVVEVEPRLRPRLLRYYSAPEPDTDALERASALDEARQRLGPALRDLALEAPLDDLAVDRVDAMLRVLPPEVAADALVRLERRIASEGAAGWAWAATACPRLLADDHEGNPRHVRFRAAIRTIQVASLIHELRDIDPGPLWEDVLGWAHDHPGYAGRRRLVRRAVLGTLAASLAADRAPTADQDRALAEELRDGDADSERTDAYEREQRCASVVAVLEALVDRRAIVAPEFVAAVAEWRRRHEAAVSPGLRAAAAILEARLAIEQDQHGEAVALASAAVAHASKLGAPTVQRWSDWVAPESIIDRSRLEALLIEQLTIGADDPRLATWLAGAQERIVLGDAERLASVIVTIWLAHGVVPAETVEQLRAADAVHDRWRHYALHRRTEPLFVVLARALTADGKPDAAIELLKQRDRAATARRGISEAHADLGRDAQLAIVEIVRRMRLEDREGPLLERLARDDAPETRAAAIRAAALVRAPARSPGGVSPQDQHARWQALVVRRGRPVSDPEVLTAVARSAGPPQDLESAERFLDHREYTLVVRAHPHLSSSFRPAEPAPPSLTEWWRLLAGSRPARPDRGPLDLTQQRTLLRAWALDEGAPEAIPVPLGELPPRRLAEMALEEGELLALRLPLPAVRLLTVAYERFRTSGDRRGVVISGVVKATALLQADRTADARRWLDEDVLPTYTSVSASDHARPPSPSSGGRRARFWGGWIGRIRVCSAWADDPKAAPDGPAGELLAARQPEQLRSRVAEPLVVGFRSRRPSEPVSLGRLLAGRPPPPALLRPVQLGPVAQTAIAIAIIAAIIAQAALVVAVYGLTTPWMLGLGLLLLAVLAGAAGWKLLRWARRVISAAFTWLLRRLHWLWRIECGIVPAGDDALVSVIVSPRVLGPAWSVASYVELPTVGSRIHGAGDVPEFLAEFRRPTVELQVDDSLMPYGWEAWLAERSPSLDVWRRVLGPRLTPALTTRRTALVAPERWLLLLEDAWAGAETVVRSFSELTSGRGWGGVECVHLLGTPAITASGTRLRVDDDAGAGPGRGAVTAAAERDQTLIGAEDLAFAGEVVIIQGAPGADDVLVGGALYGLAAEFVAAGARAALVLPALSAEDAAAAATAAAYVLVGRAANRSLLLQAARRARAASAMEDVCLVLGSDP
jgi:hypothetical protein